jgi:hypothetical protein
MFGYIRPLKGELKVKDFELFKSAYCGLCNTLKKRYGYPARFLINYDFTFLAMLLSSAEQSCGFEYKRCSASPLNKKCACLANESFELCADYSMVLYYWKLKDSLSDGGLKEKLLAGAALIFLTPAYKKAKKSVPDFDKKVRERLTELSALEKSGCASIDETADKFADILSAAAETRENEAEKRTLSQLLYHVGRQIYILDAIDDLENDTNAGLYNAVGARYDIKDGKLSDEIKKELKTTLANSQTLASSAFELLSAGMWSPILMNIIYLGIPWVTETVLNSSWRKQRNIKEK